MSHPWEKPFLNHARFGVVSGRHVGMSSSLESVLRYCWGYFRTTRIAFILYFWVICILLWNLWFIPSFHSHIIHSAPQVEALPWHSQLLLPFALGLFVSPHHHLRFSETALQLSDPIARQITEDRFALLHRCVRKLLTKHLGWQTLIWVPNLLKAVMAKWFS